MSRTSEVLGRVSKVLGAKNDTQLSEIIGKPRSTLSSWKIRKKIPYELCESVAKDYGVRLEWLLSGTGNLKEPVSKGENKASHTTMKMNQLFEELTSEQKKEILSVVEEKKRINELEKAVREMQLDKKA